MRRFVAAVVLGATTVVIYLALDGDGPANRVATCPVRISEECREAFPTLKAYETLRFPVRRDVLADGGVQILLPRASRATREGLRDCVEVMDWASCDIDPCASHAAVCAGWIDAQPFVRVRSASKHVIPDCRESDGGWNDSHAPVDCLRVGHLLDGGAAFPGCNVFERAKSTGTQCLDAPTGRVFAGEKLEDSL